MDKGQYNDIKAIISMKLDGICRELKSKVDEYDINESMDRDTLVDMISDVIVEIGDIKEFMNDF